MIEPNLAIARARGGRTLDTRVQGDGRGKEDVVVVLVDLLDLDMEAGDTVKDITGKAGDDEVREDAAHVLELANDHAAHPTHILQVVMRETEAAKVERIVWSASGVGIASCNGSITGLSGSCQF
jgi:hypothetical protein